MVQLQYGVLVMVYMTVKSMRILSFFTNSAYRATQMNWAELVQLRRYVRAFNSLYLLALFSFLKTNTPFTRCSIHEAKMKQTYSEYTRTTCALSLLHVCFIVQTRVYKKFELMLTGRAKAYSSSNLQAVTHRSTNGARRRVTSFQPKRVNNYATPPTPVPWRRLVNDIDLSKTKAPKNP